MRAMLLGAFLALSTFVTGADAANIPFFTGPTGNNPVNLPAALPDINNLIGDINVGITSQSQALFSDPRNILDNGSMEIAQRGTGIQTCGTTTIATTAYSADRWVCDANVSSGAGRAQVVTASPAPPLGFQQSVALYRTSGALTQPVCLIQEVRTVDALKYAGQTVVPSFYLQPLGGASPIAQGSTINSYVIYGTGTDQGLATLTASPAVTPAWTGLGTLTSYTSTAAQPTSTWTRIIGAPVILPTTATEIGVEICFTPGAETAGTTDGFALTGVQLEQSATTASVYEQKPFILELFRAQQFYFQINEPATGGMIPGVCEATGSATSSCNFDFPGGMRTIPTATITAGTIKLNIAGTATTITGPANGVSSVYAGNITLTNTVTAGQIGLLQGGGGAGIIAFSSDF